MAQGVWERHHLSKGLTQHLSSQFQVCNSAAWGTSYPLPCTQERPCLEVSLLERIKADLQQ
jgi:hypothetical protein